MELIQKILLALLPVYFYFAPKLLFPVFYKRYVKLAFYEIITGSCLNAAEKIAELEKRISRIIEFISFMTTAFVTFVALIYDKKEGLYFYNHSASLAFTIFFVGLSAITIINNFKQKFLISPLNHSVEIVTIFFSGALIYFFT